MLGIMARKLFTELIKAQRFISILILDITFDIATPTVIQTSKLQFITRLSLHNNLLTDKNLLLLTKCNLDYLQDLRIISN